jgi:tRNA dimethylallyltransferase
MKKVIIITGPTASGKTDVAIALAKHFNTKIISADSRQCYRELNIGVAKPSIAQLREVQHYFINSHSITEALNVADYQQLALQYLQEIFLNNDIAIVVGGTGLYIDALCYGIDPMPAVDEQIIQIVNEHYAINGIGWLQEMLQAEDPVFYATGEMQNPARMIRALAFLRSNQQSICDFKTKQKAQRYFAFEQYAIDIPREDLYNRINLRVDIMMQDGLLQEATNLFAQRHLKNLATVGYRELFGYLNNECDLDTAVGLIKQNSRHYAKRQITWCKRNPDVLWKSGADIINTFI